MDFNHLKTFLEIAKWRSFSRAAKKLHITQPSISAQVRRVLEDTAWGPYRTEFFVSYDYKAVGMGEHDKATQ